MGVLLSKTAVPVIKIVIRLDKNVIAPLRVTEAATAAATDAGIQKKKHGSGIALVISNVKMNDIMKFVEALQNCNVLIEGVTGTI